MKFRQNGHTYATPDQAYLMFESTVCIKAKTGMRPERLSFYDFCLRHNIIITDFVRCYSSKNALALQKKIIDKIRR